MTVKVATLGFPRIGKKRELKNALENYWKRDITETDLINIGKKLRLENWKIQKEQGADIIPSNDFSFYDHVLDTSFMLGVIPKIYKNNQGDHHLNTYFAMARGQQKKDKSIDVPALEMTKWFDTNYHYLVPEFEENQDFSFFSHKVIEEYLEAKKAGFETRPVILGPISFLSLGKCRSKKIDPIKLINKVLPVYIDILNQLKDAGAQWVQIDEPILTLDLNDEQKKALRESYQRFSKEAEGIKIMLTTYFGGLDDNIDLVSALPIDGLHIDLIRAPNQLDEIIKKISPDITISLGIIDGRNIWRADLATLIKKVSLIAKRKIIIAPSCSLLHTPIDLEQETDLDAELKSWLSFAVQKIFELSIISRAINNGLESVKEDVNRASKAIEKRKISKKVHNHTVKERTSNNDSSLIQRTSPFEKRWEKQQEKLHLPLFPTTTIGSFPQTKEIREKRAAYNKGKISQESYFDFLKEETKLAIQWQEEADIDVLVHGEFERNDMVQYFGEKLSGFAFTKHAWVQSYGSRYVRPPIIFGDVSRPKAMTLSWWEYAQSCTHKPVKGMLTGPVTILNWSFVRDDQPRSETCKQIAFAIRDEVCDLEKAGCSIIQIDEAALREGLPLRKKNWKTYLNWAVYSFRIASSGVSDQTQIHTHMCYSEFNDIITAIIEMDTDVISIETARSKMELLEAFNKHHYLAGIGPGVYDIHSPRIPSIEEIKNLLKSAEEKINKKLLWVNPDCGLKTRRWEEVKPALNNMVCAAKEMRQ